AEAKRGQSNFSVTEGRLALYTSGSTGTPKRIEKTLAQLKREVNNLHALWALAAGRPADETTCADPVQLRALAQKRGPYVLVSTPAHLARFPDLLPLADWQRPAMIFSSGGPLDAQSAARYREAFGCAPFEVFGSTETGGVAWRSRDGSALEDAWTTFPGIGIALGHDGAL